MCMWCGVLHVRDIIAGLCGSVLSKHAASVTQTAVKLCGSGVLLPNSTYQCLGGLRNYAGMEFAANKAPRWQRYLSIMLFIA